MVCTGFQRAKIVSIKHAEDSTFQDPIMITNDGSSRVHINQIDPYNATELEMQMLCAHLDETGRGTDSTFGTYNHLKTVRMTSIHENEGLSQYLIPNEKQLKNLKRNWVDMTEHYMEIVKGNDKKQYTYLKKLYDAIKTRSGSDDSTSL